MAGCCVVMLMLIGLPLLLVGLAVFFGFIGGAIVTLLVSIVLLIVLLKTGL